MSGDNVLDVDGVFYVVLDDVMDNALDDVIEDEDIEADDVPKEVIDFAMNNVRDGQEADEMLYDVMAKEILDVDDEKLDADSVPCGVLHDAMEDARDGETR